MKKTIILTLILFCQLSIVNSGVVDHDKMFDAYLKGDLKTWKTELTKYTTTKNLTFNDKCEIANYLYGYIGFIVDGSGKKEEVEHWLDIFDGYIELMLKNPKTESMGHVYKAGASGMRGKVNKAKLISCGITTIKEVDKALDVDETNPIAIGLKATTKLYAPAMLGRDRKKAVTLFMKAIKSLQANCPKVYRWNYRAMQLCVVEAYVEMGETEKAKAYYEKVMKEVPGFTLLKKSYETGNFGNHDSE